MKNKSNREGFLAEFLAATAPRNESPLRVFNNKVQIGLSTESGKPMPLNDREVYISKIRAEQFRQGQGSAAMQFLTALADTHGVDLVLHAYPTDKDSPGPYDLRQFYKKHGFLKGSQDLMFRPAVPVSELV